VVELRSNLQTFDVDERKIFKEGVLKIRMRRGLE
jgi:hypothetical protein